MELAHRGTIFLDEIAEISPEAQGKLVQVLDGEPFMRVGGVNPINVDVRVVAATNVPVDVTVENGRLRQDIAFRLNDFTIHMVPLRDRREDIPLLAEHFNYNYCKTYDKKYEPIADADLDTISSQRWHGNVRELSARVKEYVVTGSRESLLEEKAPIQRGMAASNKSTAQQADAEEKKPEKQFPSLKEARRQAVEATEKALIEEALEHTLWNRKKAARLLRISYSSLLRRIDTYQIDKV